MYIVAKMCSVDVLRVVVHFGKGGHFVESWNTYKVRHVMASSTPMSPHRIDQVGTDTE